MRWRNGRICQVFGHDWNLDTIVAEPHVRFSHCRRCKRVVCYIDLVGCIHNTLKALGRFRWQEIKYELTKKEKPG